MPHLSEARSKGLALWIFGTITAKSGCQNAVAAALAPSEAGASRRSLRFWIETGFKALKSVGWQWQKTRRTDPARVERHWLVLSAATLPALAYGSRVEDAQALKKSPGALRSPPKVAPERSGRLGWARAAPQARLRRRDARAPGNLPRYSRLLPPNRPPHLFFAYLRPFAPSR